MVDYNIAHMEAAVGWGAVDLEVVDWGADLDFALDFVHMLVVDRDTGYTVVVGTGDIVRIVDYMVADLDIGRIGVADSDIAHIVDYMVAGLDKVVDFYFVQEVFDFET